MADKINAGELKKMATQVSVHHSRGRGHVVDEIMDAWDRQRDLNGKKAELKAAILALSDGPKTKKDGTGKKRIKWHEMTAEDEAAEVQALVDVVG